MKNTEIWKDVVGYENCYEVSSLGRVRSKARLINTQWATMSTRCMEINYLKITQTARGYTVVSICCNGIKKSEYVHRIVALAFIPNPENKPQVNHIGKDKNGKINKKDNRVKSLEWATEKENNDHAIRTGLKKVGVGSESINNKLTEKQVIEIRRKYTPYKYLQKTLATEYGVNVDTIYNIVKRRTWKHI